MTILESPISDLALRVFDLTADLERDSLEERLDALAEDPPSFGCRNIGSGVTRLVWALSRDLVLKTPKAFGEYGESWGIGANTDEITTWLRACDSGHEYLLADVVAYSDSGGWLVMERCPQIHRHTYDSSAFCERVTELLDIEDLHESNIGVDRFGSYRVIDFAS